jgi:hypothetical protein
MTVATKLTISLLTTAAIVLAARHGATALHPSLPKDMPATSQFVQSGFDIASDEPKGDWIACRENDDRSADFCRVTDAHGTVIYQGDFVPVDGTAAVPQDQLQIAAGNDENLWVDGPSDEGPVPAIPLANGSILVPVADSIALADRWKVDPDELRRVQGL